MTLTKPLLTDQDRQTVKAVMPRIRRESPEAARIIDRLIRAVASGVSVEAAPYVSVTEAAATFGVTAQTVRNWADRGWLPCERTFSGTRRIPRSALASAQALARPRPRVPDMTPDQTAAIISAPRRKK